jgi:hypothetical protein
MRYLVGFVLFLLALGTLRVVGCGEHEGRPCAVIEDCGEVVPFPDKYDYAVYVLADDPCTRVICRSQVCKFYPIDCQDKYLREFGCRRVEFTECNPDVEDVCGDVTPINEGRACKSNCSGYFCHDGECVCESWPCLCVTY